MKLLKCYLHQVRAPAVLAALSEAGFRRMSLMHVKGTLPALLEREQDYSLDTTAFFIAEVQLEVVCEDSEAPAAAAMIREAGRFGVGHSGWVYVSALEEALPVGGPMS